jgi:hypothetical protein
LRKVVGQSAWISASASVRTGVLDELKQGGAVLVESDGGEAFLGVLTRDAG